MGDKYDLEKLFLERHDYPMWPENKEKLTDQEELTDKKEWNAVPQMQPLEGYEEEVKEGKGLKILTPNKLSTRLPALFAFICAGNK